MQKGDTGEDVKTVQSLLSLLHYNLGSIDGIYGNQTEAAVKLYQMDKGLLVTGIVDANTLNALKSEMPYAPNIWVYGGLIVIAAAVLLYYNRKH